MPVDANWDGFQSTTIPANRYQQMFINGYLDVSGRTIIRNGDLSLNDGRLFVKSDVSFNSKMFVSGDANLNGKLTVTSDASLNAKLTVASDASLNGKLTVASDASLNAKLTVASDASLNGRLTVAGDASLNGNISLNGNLYVAKNVGINNSSPTHPLDVTGNIKTTGNILVGNDASITGNATISGNLTVNGNLTATKIANKYIVNTTTNNYQLIVSEDISLNGRLFVGGNVGIGKTDPVVALDVSGQLRIYEANGTTGSATRGSLTIEHGNAGGTSSIIFPSKNNKGNDYGYITYQDDVNNGTGTNEKSILCIGTENDVTGTTINDSLILQKNGGFVGIGTNNPQSALNIVSTNVNAPSIASIEGYNLGISGTADVTRQTMIHLLRQGTAGVQNSVSAQIKLGSNIANINGLSTIDFKLSSDPQAVNQFGTIPNNTVMTLVGNGYVGIGTTNPSVALDVNGTIGCNNTIRIVNPTANNGCLRLTSSGGANYIQSGLTETSGSVAPLYFTNIYNNAISMTISTNGYVGIGITNPSVALDVSGSLKVKQPQYRDATMSFANTISKSPIQIVGDLDPNDGLYIGLWGDTAGNNSTGYIQTIIDATVPQGYPLLLNPNGGNIGIGKTNPSVALDVNGTIGCNNTIRIVNPTANNGCLRLTSSGGANYIQSGLTETSGSVAPLYFTNIYNNAISMTISTNGYVGIGITNPSVALDVVGNFAITGSTNSMSVATDTGYVSIEGYNKTTTTTKVPLVLNAWGGYVGIGTTNPLGLLQIACNNSTSYSTAPDGGSNHGLTFTSTKATAASVYSMAMGVDYSTGYGYINGAGSGAIQPILLQTRGGNVGIGTTNPSAALDVNGSIHATNTISSTNYIATRRAANTADAKTFLQSFTSNSDVTLAPVSTYGEGIYLYSKNFSGTTTVYRQFVIGTSTTLFTGQHLVVPDDPEIKTNLTEYVGLIVSSNDSGYTSYYKHVKYTGIDAIRICEALPNCKLSTIDNDKAVFGVITNQENDKYFDADGETMYDNVDNGFEKSLFDRIRVNSVGEGSIWVTNINGNIENGDYITSSIIPGYGKRQDDDLLHNYTVGKSTMSCDFDINSTTYKTKTIEFNGNSYIAAFIGCTYHCG